MTTNPRRDYGLNWKTSEAPFASPAAVKLAPFPSHSSAIPTLTRAIASVATWRTKMSELPFASLMEALWPEEPPERVANRLSVALAVLRSVLDPARAFGHQRFVTGESESVRLNVDQARRRYRMYVAALEEIGVAPSPYPGAA